MLKYCKKCGNITRKMPWDNNNYCKICNSILFEVQMNIYLFGKTKSIMIQLIKQNNNDL